MSAPPVGPPTRPGWIVEMESWIDSQGLSTFDEHFAMTVAMLARAAVRGMPGLCMEVDWPRFLDGIRQANAAAQAVLARHADEVPVLGPGPRRQRRRSVKRQESR